MKYEMVIGLEIHAELDTETKIFCSCSTAFGAEENTQTCPICLAMPGTLPVLNEKVVEYGVKAGMALNCGIAKYSQLDRKNYFYPDLPKAYQISQFDYPLCTRGSVEIDVEGNKKSIGIHHIHIEEDAGKLVHDSSEGTLADYNRGGIPLIEIVSDPDMRSAEEAKAYAEKIKAILEFTGVSNCKMQEGSLRFDVNLSIRPQGQEALGTRTEMKNLNSFRSLVRAIEHESQRQMQALEKGEEIIQETRKWDDEKGVSYSLRSKEEAQDYRYFPDPDLVPILLEDSYIERLREELPELPHSRKKRYVKELGLPEYDADILTTSRALSDYFEETLKSYSDAKAVSNWMMGDILRLLRAGEIEIEDIPFTSENFAKLLHLIEKKTISGSIGKKVLEEMFKTGKSPEDIIQEKGLVQINDEKALEDMIRGILQDNPQSVADYKAGKEKAFGFMVGQTMRISRGKANPQVVNQVLKRLLEE
ncbi:Asp-tRNA(Asn)/Glu-tRNA(Gln) amidotransferase subunit GatB [Irregularibacter muris]|uniref:Aspartyl/glutamyl-tRNA(Asn/Gln) amidotransferase subunit B n=1 Tax=Irregularibacter muris TaxID=1796619 RepID=A0AAE3HG28_9FIRM|nr:Asp-tRNA(Asn)/Glu-tRNA(Gln) amidotransferase subunit GatB [Irregularibacter muris]MCR1898779.1 Asp-tRNA(Asn)/Glu-tRNA(Gln) amidotransferase subunit GatB [Irregularibacter muris]